MPGVRPLAHREIEMSDMRYDIVIVGGSLEGAAAAWSAAQHGASVCLIESSDRLGGRYATQTETPSEDAPAMNRQIGRNLMCHGL